MAREVAQCLVTTLRRGTRWATSKLTFDEPEQGDAYGLVTVFAVGERLGFGVWLDRTATLDEIDVPILCAAFGAYGGADGKALAAIAESEDVRRQSYGYGQDERILGFGREPVIDVPPKRGALLVELPSSR